MQNRKKSDHAAFTLIELLVAIVVVGILLSLILPAIQKAREAARRARCSNNLHQCGIAIFSYDAIHNVLPSGSGGFGQSLHVSILPNLELTQAYNAFNLALGSSDNANLTVQNLHVDAFTCPSDSLAGDGPFTSYAGNVGSGFYQSKFDGVFGCDGLQPGNLSLAEVTDGTSHTGMMAEWLIGRPADFDVDRNFYMVSAPSIDRFDEQCASRSGTPVTASDFKGNDWVTGFWKSNLYDHHLPINAPNCFSVPLAELIGTATASSKHPGGANFLLADGRVRFVNRGVSSSVWRSVGTRRGGEVVPGDGF